MDSIFPITIPSKSNMPNALAGFSFKISAVVNFPSRMITFLTGDANTFFAGIQFIPEDYSPVSKNPQEMGISSFYR